MFYNPPSQQQQQQQQIPFSQSLPSFSPHFNFSSRPPPFPLPTTPIQPTVYEEHEQERSQKIHLAKYFGVPEDLMYNDTLIHKRKKQDNENDTFKLKPQYKSKKPFTTNNEVDNNAIINSDLSSVSSYVTAPEKPIMDDDNDLKHKYCDEVIKKYGCSPGKVYVDKLRLEFKVKLPQQSAQLFCDEANCEAVIAIVEHFSLAQIRIIRDYFFVTLKLNGPKFRDHAKKLSETIAKISTASSNTKKSTADDKNVIKSRYEALRKNENEMWTLASGRKVEKQMEKFALACNFEHKPSKICPGHQENFMSDLLSTFTKWNLYGMLEATEANHQNYWELLPNLNN
ncbi:hypothetical protein BDC45DRAFT_572835 [Circinella umbellata]|nr:hypothetical protein BDC45DRAFT_572835 [Circinella umbellata]